MQRLAQLATTVNVLGFASRHGCLQLKLAARIVARFNVVQSTPAAMDLRWLLLACGPAVGPAKQHVQPVLAGDRWLLPVLLLMAASALRPFCTGSRNGARGSR